MVRAIIFDCFGVLAKEKLLPFRQKYFGSNPKQLEEVNDLIGMTTAGFISFSDFLDKVSDLAGISAQSAREQIEGNTANDELFTYISKELKPRYKIGLLSNAASNRLDVLFAPEQRALLDAVVLSFEIGVTKPDPLTYQTIAGRLGEELEDCVFVDDQPRYCDGAVDVGMKAILYEDFVSFQSGLEELLKAFDR